MSSWHKLDPRLPLILGSKLKDEWHKNPHPGITLEVMSYPSDCFTYFEIPCSDLPQGSDVRDIPMMQVIPYSHKNISISFKRFVRNLAKQQKEKQNAGEAAWLAATITKFQEDTIHDSREGACWCKRRKDNLAKPTSPKQSWYQEKFVKAWALEMNITELSTTNQN